MFCVLARAVASWEWWVSDWVAYTFRGPDQIFTKLHSVSSAQSAWPWGHAALITVPKHTPAWTLVYTLIDKTGCSNDLARLPTPLWWYNGYLTWNPYWASNCFTASQTMTEECRFLHRRENSRIHLPVIGERRQSSIKEGISDLKFERIGWGGQWFCSQRN